MNIKYIIYLKMKCVFDVKNDEFYNNPRNATLNINDNFIAPERAQLLFDICENLHWESHYVKIGGRTIEVPRKSVLYSDPQKSNGYAYSGTVQMARDWNDLPEIVALCAEVNSQLGTSFNSCLLNRYADGNDYISYHADDESQLKEPGVAIISLGATRELTVRRSARAMKGNGRNNALLKVSLVGGSLLYMNGSFQDYYEHSIPKRANISDIRISLSFRTF